MNDTKIASSGAAFFGKVGKDANLANGDAVEGADRTSATVTASPAPANLSLLHFRRSVFYFKSLRGRTRNGVSDLKKASSAERFLGKLAWMPI